MSINSLLNVVIVVPWNKCGDGTGLGAGGERPVTTTLFCSIGSSVGVEIAEKTSRRGELSCAGMRLAVFQHGGVGEFKKVYFKKTDNEDGVHALSDRKGVLLSVSV